MFLNRLIRSADLTTPREGQMNRQRLALNSVAVLGYVPDCAVVTLTKRLNGSMDAASYPACATLFLAVNGISWAHHSTVSSRNDTSDS